MSEASSFRPLATCLHLSRQTDTGCLEPTASYVLHSFSYKEHYGPHRAEVGLTTDYTDLHEWAGQGRAGRMPELLFKGTLGLFVCLFEVLPLPSVWPSNTLSCNLSNKTHIKCRGRCHPKFVNPKALNCETC